MDCLDDSLSLKLLGSNGISRYSDGDQSRGAPSFVIAICLLPLLVVKIGPKESLVTFGNVDMLLFVQATLFF